MSVDEGAEVAICGGLALLVAVDRRIFAVLLELRLDVFGGWLVAESERAHPLKLLNFFERAGMLTESRDFVASKAAALYRSQFFLLGDRIVIQIEPGHDRTAQF